MQLNSPAGTRITGSLSSGFDEILTADAQDFVAILARKFGARVLDLLERRERRQRDLDAGALPDFLPETRSIRTSAWRIAGIPPDLLDRRVEITGPTERKMIINALNSGAKMFMADCEDSLTPSWHNVIQGQLNLRDAVRRTIEYVSPEGKAYRLQSDTAVLLLRPRGWHLLEKHWFVDDAQVPGAFVDFGLYLFHNAAELARRGTGPYFYLPKLESHLEARLWADVFRFAEERLGLARGEIKATVLIETILAAFEMDEILYELREHSSGLNCGRWDYIFSFIKKFRNRPDFVLPDRSLLTMEKHFLKSYVQLLIQTCHRRGIHAMGGMAAQIPIKNDPPANERALDKVRQDKLREVHAGHDGTWVAHPGLVPIAKEIFDTHMKEPNQIDRRQPEVNITAADLLAVTEGPITEEGLRWNIDVGLQYLESWLRGSGCVPIYNLMEDAATAEICRAQVWQWLRHGATLSNGRRVTPELVRNVIADQKTRLSGERMAEAAHIYEQMMIDPDFAEFLTLVAYDYID